MNDIARTSPPVRDFDTTREGEALLYRALEKLASERIVRRETLPHELKELFIGARDRAVAEARVEVEDFEKGERAKLKEYEQESLRLLAKAEEEARTRAREMACADLRDEVRRALCAILGEEDVAP